MENLLNSGTLDTEIKEKNYTAVLEAKCIPVGCIQKYGFAFKEKMYL